MGSGGLIIMDEETCMVDVARFFLEFVQEESCGKCVPCRDGTKKMLEILERITSGEGQLSDMDLLQDVGETIKKTSLCGLGQTAPNAMLQALDKFPEAFEFYLSGQDAESLDFDMDEAVKDYKLAIKKYEL